MATPRTSITHPIRIDSVSAARGRIGLTFCPGKCQLQAVTGAWERDLDLDLDAIRDWGAVVLVTLVEARELEELRVGGTLMPTETAARGIEWLHLPIVDGGVPDAAFEERWRSAGTWVRHLLRRGKSVVLHCKGGLGRTGMIAARLLVELGMGGEEAIALVRRARPGAIETTAQAEHVRATLPVPTPEYPSRVAGCLLGGAIGDALGAGIEFESWDGIRRRFGPRGASGFVPAYGQAAAITDDTQMTLFTAEGLIRWLVAGRLRGAAHAPSIVRHAYHRWLFTQGEARSRVAQLHAGPNDVDAWPDGWLIGEGRLHAQRAPGNTCLAALRSGSMGTRGARINDSKGCGGVMRAAPAGLLRDRHPDPFALGVEIAAITHGHPSGFLTAGVLAGVIARTVEGVSIRDAVAAALEALTARGDEAAETRDALAAAVRAADTEDPPTPELVERLGAGWVAEEALAIAVYCALRGERWAEEAGDDGAASAVRPALLVAVNHSGDSDSTGAITGNLIGTRLGVEALPERWLAELELRDVVERLGDDLVREVLGLAGDDNQFEQRYPGW